MRNALVPALLVAASVLSAPPASNAVEERSDSVALYGFGAFLNGDMTFGERSASIDVDPGNVIDSLEMAAFARYRHQTDRWAFVFDGQFAGLGDTRERGAVKTDLDLDLYL